MANSEAVSYGRAVVARLQEVLGEHLRGAYLSGSVALGSYVPGQSDIDIFAVCKNSLEVEKKQTLAEIISGEAANCPPRGMEFVLYSQGAVAKPSRTLHFEINLNVVGAQMSYHLSFDPASKPSHWFVLDISIGGEYGLPLVGPPAAEVFAPLPQAWCWTPLEDSLGGTPITKRSSTTVY